MEARLRGLLGDTPRLELVYEEMVADFTGTIRRVYEFLNIPYSQVESRTLKQEHRPLSQALINYHELKSSFAGSPYECFFED